MYFKNEITLNNLYSYCGLLTSSPDLAKHLFICLIYTPEQRY